MAPSGAVEAELVGPDADLLAQAAILHDVGYAPDLAVTGFHPVDGARFLRSSGFTGTVVTLVAHHSCAAVEAGLRGLSAALGEFKPGPERLAECRTYCDLTTSPEGVVATIDERLAEIEQRYGPDNLKARFLAAAAGRARGRHRPGGELPRSPGSPRHCLAHIRRRKGVVHAVFDP